MKFMNEIRRLLNRKKPNNSFRDLYGGVHRIDCGKKTLIDPEVIIDQPHAVKIGSDCQIRKGVVLRPEGGEIIIGDHCVINHYSVLHGKGGIYIGDWTIMGPHCGVYAQNHRYDRFDVPITQQENIGKGIYLMGDNWVGSHSVLCDDVTLGKGAVIGANSTVTKSVPLASIAMGSPAKVVKKRYSGTWDFDRVERASSSGMPSEIKDHVENRGKLIREILAPNDEVLDVGCGEGIITAILAEKCLTVVGCDYSLEAIRMAKQRYPKMDFTYSNSTTLRFESEKFTKVVLSDVAEHLLPRQFKRTLEEIKRVLVKGGTLILTSPLTGHGKRPSTYAHIYEYSKVEMESVLSSVFDEVRLVDDHYGLLICRK